VKVLEGGEGIKTANQKGWSLREYLVEGAKKEGSWSFHDQVVVCLGEKGNFLVMMSGLPAVVEIVAVVKGWRKVVNGQWIEEGQPNSQHSTRARSTVREGCAGHNPIPSGMSRACLA